MLQLTGVDDYKGIRIFSDDRDLTTFYVMPQFPRFRVREDGKPAFGFVKYRNPIDREDGKKGGALAAFDVELAIDPTIENEIRARCEDRIRPMFAAFGQPVPQVKISRPTFTRGTVSVSILADSKTLIERVVNPGKPSLFGNNVTAVEVEFSPEGAAVFEGVMQGKGGLGFVMVTYDLWFSARMPPIKISGHWNADKFYSYSQTVDTNDHFWLWFWQSDDSYTENISEYLHSSESYRFNTDTGTLDMGKPENVKMIQGIEDSLRRTMDDMVKRNMLEAIPAADRDVSKLRDEGYEHIKKTMTTHRSADVNVNYDMNMAVDQEYLPQGNLPSICSLKVDNKAIEWKDYAVEVDADDKFFQAIKVNLQVNADFANLPIYSVDVTLDYPPKTAKTGAETFSFKKSDDTAKFKAYIDGGVKTYKYKYTVNYKGEAKTTVRDGGETDVKTLTINVDDLGIWVVDIDTGDINYELIDSAQLTIWYEDGADVPKITKQFTLDKDHRSDEIRELIYVPRSKPYHYSVKYVMKGGREIQGPEQEGNSNQLYINNPFSSSKTVGMRTRGDFDNDIDTIFLDLAYEDTANDYRINKSFAFSKSGKRFDDWTFPVFSDKAGTLSYSGSILGKDGSSTPIAATTVTTATILVGRDPVGQMSIDVLPDLIDWDAVKLVTVNLAYKDEGNNIALTKNVTVKKGATIPPWTFPIKDKNKTSYSWSANYFMTDGSKKVLPTPSPAFTSDTALVLQPPG